MGTKRNFKRGGDIASDILARVDELEQVYKARNARMDRWKRAFDLRRPRITEAGFVPIVSNLPRVTVMMATAMLSGQEMRHHIPIFDTESAGAELANKKENLLRGIYRQFDHALNERGWSGNLQYILAQHMCLRGWYAVRPIIEEGAPDPYQIRVYDPRQCVQHWGGGLRVFAAKYKQQWSSIYGDLRSYFTDRKIKYDSRDENEWVEVVEYWEWDDAGVWNIVLVDSELAKKELTDFEQIPILTGPVNGVNTRTGFSEAVVTVDHSGEDPSDPLSDIAAEYGYEATMGLSIIDAVMPTADTQSMVLTLLMNNFEKHIDPPIIIYTADGQPRYFDTTTGATNFLRAGPQPDRVDMLRHPGPPPETAPLLQTLDMMGEQATFPKSVFGSITSDATGFAISQALFGSKYILQPFAKTLEFVFSRMGTMLLRQYANFTEPLPVWFWDSGARKPVSLQLNPFELQPQEAAADFRFDVESTLQIDLPSDKMQRATIAVQMSQAGPDGQPMMSKQTIREDILLAENSELERKRIILEKMKADPEAEMAEGVMLLLEQAMNGDKVALAQAEIYAKRLGLMGAQTDIQAMQAEMMKANGGQPPPEPGSAPGESPDPNQPQPIQGPPPPGGPSDLPADMPPELLALLGGGTPPNPPGIDGAVMPPVMTGMVPEGNVPLEQQGTTPEQRAALAQMQGMGLPV